MDQLNTFVSTPSPVISPPSAQETGGEDQPILSPNDGQEVAIPIATAVEVFPGDPPTGTADATGVVLFEDLFPTGLSYCHSRLKRGLDLSLSITALIVLSPLLIGVVTLIALTSSGPVFYWQERFGMMGRTFRLWKFRTMRPGADQGPLITARGDPRVTALGRVLRATKIDELPQLVNVVKGDMSIVGPRPQTIGYVEARREDYDKILQVRPGLTSPATLHFRDEESILGAIPEDTRDLFYSTHIHRIKINLNVEYIQNAGLSYDLSLIAKTAMAVVSPRRRQAALVNVSAPPRKI